MSEVEWAEVKDREKIIYIKYLRYKGACLVTMTPPPDSVRPSSRSSKTVSSKSVASSRCRREEAARIHLGAQKDAIAARTRARTAKAHRNMNETEAEIRRKEFEVESRRKEAEAEARHKVEEAEILQELELAALREEEAKLLSSPATSRHSRSSRSRKSSGSATLRFGGPSDSKRGEALPAISAPTGMDTVSEL